MSTGAKVSLRGLISPFQEEFALPVEDALPSTRHESTSPPSTSRSGGSSYGSGGERALLSNWNRLALGSSQSSEGQQGSSPAPEQGGALLLHLCVISAQVGARALRPACENARGRGVRSSACAAPGPAAPPARCPPARAPNRPPAAAGPASRRHERQVGPIHHHLCAERQGPGRAPQVRPRRARAAQPSPLRHVLRLALAPRRCAQRPGASAIAPCCCAAAGRAWCTTACAPCTARSLTSPGWTRAP
jgi:hypothetical protein